MAMHGTIGQFDSAVEDWTGYTKRLEQYFLANGIEDAAKCRAILLSVCGPSTYKLIRSLVAPDKLADRTFKELVDLLASHYTPKPSVIMQRYRFNSRSRQQGESVAAYVAELRRLTKFCEFGGTLDDMIRDRLVCGIGDARMQRRLLTEPKLTYKKAFELASTMETADRDAAALQQQSGSVHALTMPAKKDQSPRVSAQEANVCSRCGGDHRAADCCFEEAICRWCEKKGHIARACRSGEADKQQRHRHGQGGRGRRHAHVLGVQEPQELAPEYALFQLGSRAQGTQPPLRVSMRADEVELPMVDTGAAVSVVSECTYRRMWPPDRRPKLQPTDPSLCTYTGQQVKRTKDCSCWWYLGMDQLCQAETG